MDWSKKMENVLGSVLLPLFLLDAGLRCCCACCWWFSWLLLLLVLVVFTGPAHGQLDRFQETKPPPHMFGTFVLVMGLERFHAFSTFQLWVLPLWPVNR
ncbi:hypothetical protein CMV_030808 [Castanea mollissima]|uniref:Uncharacterized protein n=1 Tax=Castanea mollissima TaxID=60419 RepID=A0A8J4Q2F4_9ROSI|nr:hypothetical protein CMV_030808 [Castanea mollissima]